MNWRAWWARLSARERMLIGAAGVVLVLALVRFLVIVPFLAYREGLRDEIAAHRARLENGQAYLARASEVNRHHELLRARFAELRAQLVPGNTPTLAAASLQDTLHSLAGEKGINIQSTQVMREETVGDFRRIAVRVTVTGELRQLADFLAGIEHGPRRVSLPFLEISRRGAVLRGQSARALAATIEVSAFVREAEDDAAAAEGEEAAPDSDAPAESEDDASGGDGSDEQAVDEGATDGKEANGKALEAPAASGPGPAAGTTPAPPGSRPRRSAPAGAIEGPA
jgi:Tfp pilus assembly protein PilO